MSDYERRKSMTQALWLNYFNQTLFEKGIITEGQRNQLKRSIMGRRPSPPSVASIPCKEIEKRI